MFFLTLNTKQINTWTSEYYKYDTYFKLSQKQKIAFLVLIYLI